MLEKIKEVPFIDESSAVKVLSVDGKIELERNDRVVWAAEKTAIESEGIDCYVEADKFFALFPDIKSLKQGTCLEVTLKNGARYELPFLTVEWSSVQMPEDYDDSITFKLSDLMLCTLKNLVRPELQCIYIDQQGAVSCDFISACVSKEVKASAPFLLPPDIQDLVDGRLCKVKVTDTNIYIQASDFSVVTSRPTMSEDAWWEGLRDAITDVAAFADAAPLAAGMKRLAMFGDYVNFDGDRVVSGSNYEPFAFANLEGNQYEIEKVSRILSTATHISEKGGNLVLKNESSMFLISPMDEA